MVEQSFRTFKSVLETRPIYHRCDATIRGHVFCSFLALVLLKELLARLKQRGWEVEWDRLRANLDTLEEMTVEGRGGRSSSAATYRGTRSRPCRPSAWPSARRSASPTPPNKHPATGVSM